MNERFTHFGSCFWNCHDISASQLEVLVTRCFPSRELLRKRELVVDRDSWYSCSRFIDVVFFFMHIASFTFVWSTVALWLALWCCQVKPSFRWHCSGHQHQLVKSGWCVPWSVFQLGVWFHLCICVQGPDRMLSCIWPHTSCLSASCLSGVRGWSVECSRVCGTHWHRVVWLFWSLW